MDWSVNDKKYKKGAYFEVIYLPENPKKSKIKFTNPVNPKDVCSFFKGKCPFSGVKEKD